MVGGTIAEIVVVNPERWWLKCQGIGSEAKQSSAIYVNPKGHSIQVGDSIWWQNGRAWFRSQAAPEKEIELRKMGGSGVERPTAEDLDEEEE